MFKNALFTKTVCLTTLYAFAFAIMPRPSSAQTRLVPLSFSEMYSQAEDGEVEALRAAVHRGMNIDVMDSNGDTGLCIAAKRRDVYTYNSFRAAGANPRHPCTQNISGYADFLERSDVVGMNDTSRTAYAAMGDKEKYRVSPKIWWWVGGAAVAGGVALYFLLKHKHGGKKDDNGGGGDTPVDPDDKEDYFSLGANIATKGKALQKTSGNAENTKLLRFSNDNVEKIKDIDLRKKALSNTQYMNAILYAQDGGSYVNAADTLLDTGLGTAAMTAVKKSSVTNNGYIKVDSYNASVGMVASEGSTAYNYGKGIYKKASSENIETDDGISTNSNGISLNFSGYAENDTIVGMYADTKSTIENHGDIQGTAIQASETSQNTSSSSGGTESVLSDGNMGATNESSESTQSTANTGTIIGMEAMILNVGTTLNKDVIHVLNGKEGIINLTAGDNGDGQGQIKLSLVGMGSFLDNAFLNGSHIVSRAENVELKNEGTINLSYTGNYTATSSTALRKGLGGIVGIRSDANTTAQNSGSINIVLHDEFQDEGIDVAAGMQSLHGGDIINSGTIKIATPTENKRVNYGMLAVEGSGANSSLYTEMKPNVDNSGNIHILLSNSFGMASFVGGTVHNSGNITLGSEETRFYDNIAMYGFGDTQKTDLKNTGTIDIYTHKSIAMQNDYAGGTDIINDGIINIHESAMDSYVFGGAYSRIYNDNTINYDATSSKQDNPSYNGVKFNPFANYSVSFGTSIISTKARSIKTDKVDFSSSSTEGIYNNKNAVINMNGSSFVAAMTVEKNDNAESTQAKAYNYGVIEIKDRKTQNATNSIGLYMDEYALNNAGIFNHGTIKTSSRFSAAMVSESLKNSDVINKGTIETAEEYSLGIYASDYSNIHNYGKINIKDSNSTAIHVGKNDSSESDTDYLYFPEITNEKNSVITVGSKSSPAENSYGIYVGRKTVRNALIDATITNKGKIDLYTKVAGAAIYSSSASKIINSSLINVYGDNSYGIFNEGTSDIVNNTGAIINVGTEDNDVKDSYAIYNTGSGSISNKGTINLYNDDYAYAIYSSGNAEIVNEGLINLQREKGTAVYAAYGRFINKKPINILKDGGVAAEISFEANMLNDTDVVINVGSEENPVSGANAIIATADAVGTIINRGTINLYNGGGSHAVTLGGKSTFINDTDNGLIYSYNDYTDVIMVTGNVNVYNNTLISAIGNSVTAVRGGSVDSVLSLNNNGSIIVGDENTNNLYNSGVVSSKIGTVNNYGEILVYSENGHGIYADESSDEVENSGIENSGTIKVSARDSVGIYGGGVYEVTNNGTIQMGDESSKAIETNLTDTGTSQTISNNGSLILLSGNNTYGIYSRGAVDINNSGNGRINVGTVRSVGYGAYGIHAQDANSIINNSKIVVFSRSAGGIYGGKSIKNTGDISVTGGSSVGIYGSSINTSIENAAHISIDIAQGSSGIASAGQTSIINHSENSFIYMGSEEADASQANGIYAPNALSIANDANIFVYASSSNGISGGEVISNSGRIYVHGRNSNGIYGNTNNTSITNSNDIKVNNANGSAGIYSSGQANIKNTGETRSITIGCNCEDISATDAYGIYGLNSNYILNQQDIYVYAKSSSGISGGIEVDNSGEIYVSGDESIGIFASEDNHGITNSASITIPHAASSSGIYTNGATTISSSEGNSIILGSEDITLASNVNGIYAPNSNKITNSSVITIFGEGSTAIVGHDYVTNNATLSLLKGLNNKGISADGSSSVLNKGMINIPVADGSYGIYTTGTSNVDNQATISIGALETPANGAYGIYTEKASQIDNSGQISILASSSTGIYTENSGTINNGGVINISGDNSTGIYSAGATKINNNASITLDKAINSYGIRSTGTGAVISNNSKGIITIGKIGSLANFAYGIHATGATKIENSANISIYASDSYGIYANSVPSITNLNGIIYVSESGARGIYSDKANVSVSLSDGGIELPSASNSAGIYITNGTGAVEIGNGSIIIGSGSVPGGSGNYGVYVEQGSVKNYGSITLYGNGMGIEGNNHTSVIAKNINIAGTGTAINQATTVDIVENGNINVANGDAIIALGNVTNDGTISVANGRGITTIGTVTNTQTGIINVSGIAVQNAVSLTNSGSIRGNATGNAAIYNVDSVRNLTKDSIIRNDNGKAIYKFNIGPLTVVNEGTIRSSGTAIQNNTGQLNVTNSGSILVTGDGHGIYNRGPTSVTNSGLISISGEGDGIHIYVPDPNTPVSVTNTGVIRVTDGYGIYIYKNYHFVKNEDDSYTPAGDQVNVPDLDSGTKIECNGSICVIPETRSRSLGTRGIAIASVDEIDDSSLIGTDSEELLGNVKILNLGSIQTAGAVNFGSADDENKAQVSIGDGGSYEAESFSGQISADTSIVEGGFETTYVNENSFVGENKGIEVVSESYMFDADTQENTESGNTDVVMTMKAFDEVVEDDDISEFLEQNYEEQHGEEIFDTLKTAQTQEQFDDYLNKQLGFSMLPNLAKQSLDVEKTISANVNDELLNINGEPTRYAVNTLVYKNNVKAKGQTSGYKDKVVAVHGFGDKEVAGGLRMGLGIQISRLDSDFDDKSTRYNNMAEIFAPIIFHKNNLAFMTKPKAGFAHGHYRRVAVDNTHKATTKEYYYGLDNIIRQNIDLNLLEIEPDAEFNLTGMYMDDIEESANGLKIKDKNVLSAQSVLGITARKRFEINSKSALGLAVNAKYFHEFGKKYKNRATVGDMVGYYDIISNRLKRDFGLIGLKAQYDYQQFTLDASANLPLEEKHEPYYMLNVKYKF